MKPKELIEDKIKHIIAENINCSIDLIKNKSRFMYELDADSLDILEIIMEIERHFEIDIPDEDILNGDIAGLQESLFIVQNLIDLTLKQVEAKT